MRDSSLFFVTLLMLAAAIGAVPIVAANDVFISEYVEGSSNNKALELFNPTGAAIDLGAGGYQVWMYFNGSVAAGAMKPLTGVIPSMGTYVLANPSADPAILAVADQVDANTTWYNGDDVVALVKPGPVFVDVIGQFGYDPGTEWGTGDTSTADNTLRRNASVCQGDPDGSDPFDPSLEWSGFPTNTFDGLGSHVSNCVPVAVESVTWDGVKRLYR